MLTDEPMDSPSICIANVGPRGRRQRMGFGVALLAVGGLAVAVLLSVHTAWFWSVAVFLPFWAGGLGVFQATGKT